MTRKAPTPGAEISCKWIWKNILATCTAFFFQFLAFFGMVTLQSSLHSDAGLGTISQSVLYATLMVSCLFLPKIVIQKLGHKWTMTLSVISYLLWVLANGYPVWATMILSCFFIGVTGSTLWAAQSSYFVILGKEYARKTNQSADAVLGLFFGIFFSFYQASGLFGAIVSSTVLRQSPPENFTGPTLDELALCGINDCPSANTNATNSNLEKPDDALVWPLIGVYGIMCVVAMATSGLLVNPVPKHLMPKSTLSPRDEIVRDLKSTITQIRKPKQLLLIPITIFRGLDTSFKQADWNKSYVTCNIGIWMVGYTFMAFALANTITSLIVGRLVKVIGHQSIMLFAFIMDVSIQCLYAFWIPDPAQLVMFFVLPALGGVTDACWQITINTVYGTLFHDTPEAAFSNFWLWQSIGFAIAFGISSAMCTSYKISILVSFLVVGMVGIAVNEWLVRLEKQKESQEKVMQTEPDDKGEDNVVKLENAVKITSFA